MLELQQLKQYLQTVLESGCIVSDEYGHLSKPFYKPSSVKSPGTVAAQHVMKMMPAKTE